VFCLQLLEMLWVIVQWSHVQTSRYAKGERTRTIAISRLDKIPGSWTAEHKKSKLFLLIITLDLQDMNVINSRPVKSSFPMQNLPLFNPVPHACGWFYFWGIFLCLPSFSTMRSHYQCCRIQGPCSTSQYLYTSGKQAFLAFTIIQGIWIKIK
jgi:hypothetical protein